MKEVLEKYQKVFSNSPYDTGLFKTREYSVETSTSELQLGKLSSLAREAQIIVQNEIKKLIKAGILERINDASVITSTFIPIK